MLSKKVKRENAKKTREEENSSEENKEEETLEGSKSGSWKKVSSLFKLFRSKQSDPPQSPTQRMKDKAFSQEERNGANAEHDRVETRDEVLEGPSTRYKRWIQRKRETKSVTFQDADASQMHLLEACVAGTSGHDESDGYGSYFMPCCPCAADLDDQPCMPQWCFSYKYIDWLAIVTLIFCFIWGTVYSFNAETASPNGALFTLGLAAVLAYAAGFTAKYFMKIPQMIFMLVVGFLFVNSPLWSKSAHFGAVEVEAVTAFILTIMSTKAALYFDGKIFMKHTLTILLLGIVPCAGEIFTVGGVLYVVCGLDPAISFATATVLANVSSVMISHALVTLADAGYGARSGILSLLMAAAPINSLIVLSVLGISFQDERIVTQRLQRLSLKVCLLELLFRNALKSPSYYTRLKRNLKGRKFEPIEAVQAAVTDSQGYFGTGVPEGIPSMEESPEVLCLAGSLISFGEQLGGVAAGTLIGALLAFFPHRNNVNATLQRTIMHILSIMCVHLLCQSFGVLYVGHLFNTAAACATVNCLTFKNWTIEVMMLKDTFEMIWHGLQPAAVILACSMIDFAKLNVEMIWQSCFVFFISYIIRGSLVFLSTHLSGKPMKQRIFMSLCWTARGLTQGFLSSSLIAFVKKKSTPQQTLDVITIFTVNLIVGNVIGGLQIWFLGPKLLPRNEPMPNT